MVITTCLSARSENASMSQRLRDYFSKLIQPLTTTVGLEEMFKKLKKEIITNLKKNLGNKRKKIE